MTFAHDYDLEALKLIRPRGQQFQLHVTPRFSWHYEQNQYKGYTARLLAKFCERASFSLMLAHITDFSPCWPPPAIRKLRIIAAEPVRENFEIFTRNIQFNGFKK